MPQRIRLYDLARAQEPNICWSYNVWKTRMALNFKKLPYETIWVDSNSLGPELEALGLSPNSGGYPYTVPTIVAPDTTTVVTDSTAIALTLEQLAPSPSLHLNEALEKEVDSIVHETAIPLFAIYLPRVTRDLIDESTVQAFRAPREKRLGVTLEELEKSEGGEKAWTAARPGFESMKTLLTSRKKDEGPFILGSTVCYADFILVALFEAFRQAGEDLFDRATGYDESFAALYKAAHAWLAGNQ